MKIINYVYFKSLPKAYFRNKENWYNEPFQELSELSYLYFSSNFGIEKISKRKFVEFVQSCFATSEDEKRVSIFRKYFLVTFDKKSQSNGKNTFIRKNIVLFLEFINETNSSERIIIHSQERGHNQIYLLHVYIKTD